MKKKILLTGGNGFIGTKLCKLLQERGHDFLVLTNRETEFFMPECLKQVDLNDAQALQQAVSEYRPDAIAHLAAIASPVYGDVPAIYRVNVCGTENLLNAACCLPEQTRVVLISTAGVYGAQEEPYLHEALPFNPLNHYSYSKMITEVMSRQYADRLSIQIVRPFNIVGRGQNENFLIPKLVKAFRERVPQLKMGNLDAVRDFVSVDFCVQVLYDLLFAEKTIQPALNICTGCGNSCRDVLNLLEELTGYCPEIVVSEDFVRSNEIWSLVGDTHRLDAMVQGRYKSPALRDILKDMLQ